MNGAFDISGVGLVTQQRALEAIAGNIANINTPAYKRADIRFADMVARQADGDAVRADLSSPAPMASVTAHTIFALDEPGEIELTGRTLDLAVSGRGFIELMGPRGQTLLWRGGSLSLDANGFLTGPGGAMLAGLGALPQDATSVAIDANGLVSALRESGERTEIGRLSLLDASAVQNLERRDAGIFVAGDAAELIALNAGEEGAGAFVQGALERSNVDLNREMVQLMIVQRAFSANAQILQAADQMMAIANGLRK